MMLAVGLVIGGIIGVSVMCVMCMARDAGDKV